jgi:hypothetical protein
MLPVGLDLSILAFAILNLVLIRAGRRAPWVARVPWIGAAGTVYLNWSSAESLPSQIGHSLLAALWIAFSEIAAHVYAAHINALHDRPEMEGVRPSRWFLDPVPTARIWRQMKLWEITSYNDALRQHKELAVYRQRLQQIHGDKWRTKATPDELLPLRLARHGMTVAQSLAVPLAEEESARLRVHDRDLRLRAADLRMRQTEATEAIEALKAQTEMEAAQLEAETIRLKAETELAAARAEAQASAEAALRESEAALRVREAEAEAEAKRVAAEAEARIAELQDAAAQRAFDAQRERESAQLKWEEEQREAQVRREAAERATQAELARQERVAAAEERAEQLRLEAEQQEAAARRAKAAEAALVAQRDAAVAEQETAVALQAASVAKEESARRRAEAERLEEQRKVEAARTAALVAEQERLESVALEAAAVAAASARRSPAEREALIVADWIRRRARAGQAEPTIPEIGEKLDLPHATAQDRRDRARRLVEADPHGQAAPQGRVVMPMQEQKTYDNVA